MEIVIYSIIYGRITKETKIGDDYEKKYIIH